MSSNNLLWNEAFGSCLLMTLEHSRKTARSELENLHPIVSSECITKSIGLDTSQTTRVALR
jgi:hypothetical protein